MLQKVTTDHCLRIQISRVKNHFQKHLPVVKYTESIKKWYNDHMTSLPTLLQSKLHLVLPTGLTYHRLQ